MKTTRQNQGFGVTEIVIVIAVIIIIGALGFLGYNRLTNSSQPSPNHQASDLPLHHDTMDMPAVDTINDLDKAATSLDDPSFDNDGISDLDSQIDGI